MENGELWHIVRKNESDSCFILRSIGLLAYGVSPFTVSLRYDELKNVVDGAAAVHCAHRTRYHLVFRKNLAGLFIREDEFRLDSVLKIVAEMCPFGNRA